MIKNNETSSGCITIFRSIIFRSYLKGNLEHYFELSGLYKLPRPSSYSLQTTLLNVCCIGLLCPTVFVCCTLD